MAAYSFLGPQRAKLYRIIFGTDTRAGRLFDLLLIVTILTSVTLIIVESFGDFTPETRTALRRTEVGFTLLFTVEYFLRIFISPKPLKYVGSFWGVIDLFSVLPVYIAFFFPDIGYLLVIRLIRVLRIFRVLNLVDYMAEGRFMLGAVRAAGRKIFIFFFFVLVLATIFGSLLFLIEGPEHGFTSIPRSIYWAVITITTVGYGDIVPQTGLGKGIAALVTLIGYAVIAVPTGIITAEIGFGRGGGAAASVCGKCGVASHQVGANYCRACGQKLPEK